MAQRQQGGSSAAASTGAGAAAAGVVTDAQRTRQLEAMMHAAMENPVTYEEQIRRERLAHLRMMYTVSFLPTGISC